jgi:hypothetical protein
MSFFKTRGQEAKAGPLWGLVLWGGEDIRKGHKQVNMVEILCSHV